MKSMKLNIKTLSFLAIFFMVFAIVACEDEDSKGGFTSANLNTLIDEAENIIKNNVEGTNAGDYAPGSIAKLQASVDWVNWKIDNATSQSDLDDAVAKLQAAIDLFKVSIVAIAMPHIQQENDTWIQISDNIKDVLKGAFTIELDCYIVDLNPKGWSNNLFSCEQDNPDSGFGVRYFGDGKIQVVVGDGSWGDTGDQAAGILKAGEWIKIVLTNTGSEQTLYINGTAVASQTKTHQIAADVPFVIGNSPKWTDRVCNTVVKEFRIWSKVLDENTVKANMQANFDGTEDGLSCYFPLGSFLGNDFKDVTGNYTATLKGKIEWVEEAPLVEWDNSDLKLAIDEITAFKETVAEGTNDGDYPLGTIEYINSVIDKATSSYNNERSQDKIDEMTDYVREQVVIVKSTLVADSDGIFIDRNDPNAVGLRITPNYTPQGNYTVEFEVKVRSFYGYGTGEFFNNGEYGIWVYGIDEYTEDDINNAGGLRNFTSGPNGWETGPTAPGGSITKNNWHQVAVIHDEDVNGYAITIMYVDGIETGRDTIGVPNVSGWGETWLGNGWGKMDGYIKDFRLWDEARDVFELGADISGDETNLKMYFPLDRVKGFMFKDETGNFDGEMRGISWNK